MPNLAHASPTTWLTRVFQSCSAADFDCAARFDCAFSWKVEVTTSWYPQFVAFHMSVLKRHMFEPSEQQLCDIWDIFAVHDDNTLGTHTNVRKEPVP